MGGTVAITDLVKEQVLLLDGAMGTMLQRYDFKEDDYYFDESLKAVGCNELLNITRSDVIKEIHLSYLKAGSDIIETNTFGANRFSLEQYGLVEHVDKLNKSAVENARCAIEQYLKENPYKALFVAGVVGPSGKMASLSSSVDDPTYRDISFDTFVEVFKEQIKALVQAGSDLLLIETVFDTLVAKAALVAADIVFKEEKRKIPIMLSATFSDGSARTLGGQTVEALTDSLASYDLFSLGLNCSTGAKEMIPLIKRLSSRSPFYVSAHPNAGFPNHLGEYSQSPKELSDLLKPLLEEGQLNIVGGCCGTTPEHIKSLSEILNKAVPRERKGEKRFSLAGLEALSEYIKRPLIIGERTNVAGSKKFENLIREGAYEKALAIARNQIENGAQVIDICMDAPLIDAKEAMVKFLRLANSDPFIASVPFMIDSSDWEVLKAALKEIQGTAIVNSISLKEGEELFLEKARYIEIMGGVAIVMLFDEKGQADTFQRKIEVAFRAKTLLDENGIFKNSYIIFDPNVLAIATAIDEHDLYAKDFIEATRWIKENLKDSLVIGGISNLSFSFRGNNPFREALHAVFLKHATEAGLDMALINPAAIVDVNQLDTSVVEIMSRALLAQGDLVANRETLIERALTYASANTKKESNKNNNLLWRKEPVFKRLTHALFLGESEYLKEDLKEVENIDAVELIEGPLMEGMSTVGSLFGEGKLFLPQVVRSARTMKMAVDILRPRLNENSKGSSEVATIVLATVKGDVHDIGKNIVSLVLQCNNFKVIDLGVMVPNEKIVESVKENSATLVGLSGLITPSLAEMEGLCSLFEKEKMGIPILVGGATTSKEHTAIKLSPLYGGGVFHASDASDGVATALRLISKDRAKFKEENFLLQTQIKRESVKKANFLSLKEARQKRFIKTSTAPKPTDYGIHLVDDVTVGELLTLINWRMICQQWRVPFDSDEGKTLISDAKILLHKEEITAAFNASLRALVGIYPTKRVSDEIIALYDKETEVAQLRFFRSQIPDNGGLCRSLSDYIHPSKTDSIGLFVASSAVEVEPLIEGFRESEDHYNALLLQTIADRMVEAFSLYLQKEGLKKWWPVGNTSSIRPAVGYPVVPDHHQKRVIFSLLGVEDKIKVFLTDSYAMKPVATVCGFYFVGEGLSYFDLGGVGLDQLNEYALWADIGIKELKQRVSIGEYY